MRKLLSSIYGLIPLKIKAKYYLPVKDLFFADGAEHLYHIVRIVNKFKINTHDKLVIDVGAADGSVALFFQKYLQPQQTLAFEPVPYIYPKLFYDKNPNVQLFQFALSNTKDTQSIYITSNAYSSSLLKPENNDEFKNQKTQIIETVLLDDFLKEKNLYQDILLLKIDVQGNELNLLKGAIQTLEKIHIVLIEQNNHHIYQNASKYYEVDEFLRQNGFVLINMIATYKKMEIIAREWDAIYLNKKFYEHWLK